MIFFKSIQRLSIIIAFFTLFSCSSSSDVEPPNEIPEITFISFEPSTTVQAGSTLNIRIQYRDGDGDIGENIDGLENLFVQDARLPGIPYAFRVQQLAPDNSEVAIQGELKIALSNVPMVDLSNTQEETSFEIYLIDRAGNESNRITTPTINVVSQ